MIYKINFKRNYFITLITSKCLNLVFILWLFIKLLLNVKHLPLWLHLNGLSPVYVFIALLDFLLNKFYWKCHDTMNTMRWLLPIMFLHILFKIISPWESQVTLTKLTWHLFCVTLHMSSMLLVHWIAINQKLWDNSFVNY